MKSILTIIFLLCLGQSLAVGVHAGTWWLRRHALGALATVGALCGTIISLSILFILGMITYDEDGNWPAATAALHQHEYLVALSWFAAFCLGVILLGLHQSYQLEGRWQWRLWAGASLALWAEIAFAWWLSGRLANFSEMLLGPTRSPAWLSGHNAWSFGTYAVTLLILAFFHPLFLRLTRSLPTTKEGFSKLFNR